ncbi:hypothetical protein Q427_09135 [Halomonas sp. BC04]|nr:hypothetical protein Q427_09135 [Halomonas sp. BC04]
MRLSDLSVQRPVMATVLALLIVAFGLLAMQRLPLQEYPSIDPPVVSIDTRYAAPQPAWWRPGSPSCWRTASPGWRAFS